jgi:hypothetical protein
VSTRSCPPVNSSSFAGLIGVAREDITPPIGIYARNWGAAKHDVAQGVHRPLTLTCLTFQSTRRCEPLVLMAADLGWWKSAEDEFFVRDGLLEALALEPARLLFCLSHTHAGPSLSREDASKPGGQFIEAYLRELRESAIHAAQRALSTATAAVLTWHSGHCDLATNRDLPEKTGKRFLVGFNPGPNADDTLLVGRVTNQDHLIIATLVNYACHPTTLAWKNRQLSPDYVGAMRELVESQTQATCLFLQGASGELAPAEQYVGDLALAESYGRRLGHAALATLEGMLPPKTQLAFSGVVESGAPLAIWKRSIQPPATTLLAELVAVKLPLKSLPPLAQIERQWRKCQDRVMKERLWRQRMVRKTVGEGESAQVPLWIWRLGDSFFVAHPTEAYSEFQQKLRRKLAPHAVTAIDIANGYMGYLPPRRLYGKNIYPVWQTPFGPGALEKLTQAASRTARHLLNT